MLKRIVVLIITLCSWNVFAQEWRIEPITFNDLHYISKQVSTIDDLARLKLGRQINGKVENDIAILQLLLDKNIVKRDQIVKLQAMGIILGVLLKEQKGLNWVVFNDKLGRSRALQVLGIEEFIFPATQISRLAEVGLIVNVAKVYAELEQAVVDVKNTPKYFK